MSTNSIFEHTQRPKSCTPLVKVVVMLLMMDVDGGNLAPRRSLRFDYHNSWDLGVVQDFIHSKVLCLLMHAIPINVNAIRMNSYINPASISSLVVFPICVSTILVERALLEP